MRFAEFLLNFIIFKIMSDVKFLLLANGNKIFLVIHSLDINLGFFREARLSGAYLLSQLLKANINSSNYKSVWSEEASLFVFKNASITSCNFISNQSQLNRPVSL